MATKYPGVSPPISTKLPTKSEIRLTEALENTLQAYGMYEDKRRTEERYIVHIFFFKKKQIGNQSNHFL